MPFKLVLLPRLFSNKEAMFSQISVKKHQFKCHAAPSCLRTIQEGIRKIQNEVTATQMLKWFYFRP